MLKQLTVIGPLLIVALFTLAAEDECGSSDEGASLSTESPAAEAPTDQVSVTQDTPAAQPTENTGFGDGTYVVGQDVQPGMFRTDGGDRCYLARLSGFGGSIDEIIANDNGSGPQIVAIASTDAGFETARCGDWVIDSGQARPDPNAPFGEGIFAVGRDVSPGTWRTEAGDACYWARLSGFGRTIDDIITNDNASGSAIVTIDASDVGFEVSGCGEWTKVQ